MEIELTAGNIKCGGCAQAIRDGLADLADDVEVDIDTGKVLVRGKQLDETAIRNKLADLGYPAA